MVIVKLMGGLGNQLFQYAAARSLAHRHNTALKLDISCFDIRQAGDVQRKFELDNFCITAEKASKWELTTRSGIGATVLRKTLAGALQRFYGYEGYCENGFRFDDRMHSLPDNVYLQGYMQSERYFVDITGLIRREFTVKTPLTGNNLKFSEEIAGNDSVAVHVRRGDYVTSDHVKAVHGVCGLEYYLGAVEKLLHHVENPHFFVFSDDPEWAAGNLKFHHPTRYVCHNGGVAHEDLRLMSLCRHHIIANSSFSWWGAWLSANPGKVVIAPLKWFNDKSFDTSDLIPESWIRI